ncbi:MAG: hypothetical protein AAFO93_14560 [Pseudomonadota bacterium]
MLPIAGLILGALYGALLARGRKGKTLDMLQYAAGFAILGGVLGMLAFIILSRL